VGSDAIPGPEDTAEVSLIGPAGVVEGATTTNYTLSIDEIPLSDVTVTLVYSGVAADGTDFTGVASQTIASGTLSKTFSIDTLDDVYAEGAESFTVTIDTITGGGYENVRLVLFHSDKKKRESQVGMFGEGLKLISAAALRNNLEISYRSRDWAAKPYSRKLNLEEGKTKQTVMTVATSAKGRIHPRQNKE